MTKTFAQRIAAMNAMYKLPAREHPALPEDVVNRLTKFKATLMDEVHEIDDIVAAAQKGAPSADILVAMADLLGDVIVYCRSEALKYGLPLEDVLDIIMDSNESKLGADGKPIYDANGKFLKGPNYWKPEPKIKALLEKAASQTEASRPFITQDNTMPLTMYAASTPRFVHMLNNLSALLDKAQAHIDARKLDPAALTTARLFPDMFHLARQVQVACDISKGAVARLGGVEVPKHEDTEQTIAELKARIAKTVAFIEGVPQAAIDASADRDITLKLGKQDYTFKGMDYLLKFAQPNFYFHVTTAYNILRHNGVELIKKDYVGKF